MYDVVQGGEDCDSKLFALVADLVGMIWGMNTLTEPFRSFLGGLGL